MAQRGSACANATSAKCGTRTESPPAWPLGYDVFEPYYSQAEVLYHVHGQRGEDPTEPRSSAPYAYPAVKHEARIQCLSDILQREGLHPFHLPLGIKLDQNPDGRATTYSPCIRCDAFDGFPCAVNAKADAQVICVDPTRAALRHQHRLRRRQAAGGAAADALSFRPAGRQPSGHGR